MEAQLRAIRILAVVAALSMVMNFFFWILLQGERIRNQTLIKDLIETRISAINFAVESKVHDTRAHAEFYFDAHRTYHGFCSTAEVLKTQEQMIDLKLLFTCATNSTEPERFVVVGGFTSNRGYICADQNGTKFIREEPKTFTC